VHFADLKLTWRNRNFYSSGTGEATLATAPDLGALQTAVIDPEFAGKLRRSRR
jgi:hypothetical protein